MVRCPNCGLEIPTNPYSSKSMATLDGRREYMRNYMKHKRDLSRIREFKPRADTRKDLDESVNKTGRLKCYFEGAICDFVSQKGNCRWRGLCNQKGDAPRMLRALKKISGMMRLTRSMTTKGVCKANG